MELHFLELPKLPSAPTPTDDQAVLNWGQFFTAQSDEELEQLAMTDPDIKAAKGGPRCRRAPGPKRQHRRVGPLGRAGVDC